MTDDQMDARLRAAGERWRAANSDAALEPQPPGGETVEPVSPPRRRRWGVLASAALVAAALVVGGTIALRGVGNGDTSDQVGNSRLEGTVWQLQGYGKDRFTSSYATFYIGTDGELVADDDCTLIGAKANPSDGHLHPTDISVRNRSCTDSTPPTFTTGLDILTTGPSYTVDGDRLTISDGSTDMHLVAMPGAVPPTLDVPTFTDTDWRLAQIIYPDTRMKFDGAGEKLRISDGKLTAGYPCGTITADVSEDGPRVDLKNRSDTSRGCLNPTPQVVVANVLSGSFQQTVTGGRLTLTNKDAGILVYGWVPGDPQATDPNQSLTGGTDYPNTTWHLVSVAGSSAVGTATLRFAGGYVGTDGCSRFSGPVAIDHGTIEFTGVPKAPSCGGAKGTQASTIDSFLNQTALWSVRNGKLIINGGGAQAFALVYAADRPLPATIDTGTSLAGTRWTLASIDDNSANSSSGGSAGLGITLRFATASRFAANYGCVFDLGSYVALGNTLHLTAASSASTMCPSPGPTAGQRREYRLVQNVLQGDVSWKLEADDLFIVKDGTTLTFRIGSSAGTTNDTPLTGTTWNLTRVTQDTAKSRSDVRAAGSGITVSFTGNRYRAEFVCGSYDSGRWTGTADTLAFMVGASARGSCAVPAPRTAIVKAGEFAEQFFHGGSAWQIDGNELTLTNGSTSLVFEGS